MYTKCTITGCDGNIVNTLDVHCTLRTLDACTLLNFFINAILCCSCISVHVDLLTCSFGIFTFFLKYSIPWVTIVIRFRCFISISMSVLRNCLTR